MARILVAEDEAPLRAMVQRGLQATGFEDWLPVGTGLLAPRTVEEAADAIRRIRADYATHADAARTIAREYFDSATVLARLLKDVGV